MLEALDDMMSLEADVWVGRVEDSMGCVVRMTSN